MFALAGRVVLTCRNCGSKMSGFDVVLNRTSEVRERMIVNENGEVV
jgi:hypothetical protein